MLRMESVTALLANCPQCGAEIRSADGRCWLCRWKPGDVVPPPVVIAKTPAREPGPWQFTIGGLLIVTTVIAVCFGALRTAPGLGVLLIILLAVSAVPAVIRAQVLRSRRQADDSPRGASERRLAYVESFAVTIGAIIAGSVVCGVVAIVAVMVACSGWNQSYAKATEPVAMVLLFGSPVIGLIVAGLIYWLAWPKASKT
jgi:uncharacterized membrane protein YfcA